MFFYIIFYFLISCKIIKCQKCAEGKDFCKNCNPITKLCDQCYNSDVLTPDKNGGCEGIKKCEVGKNYCNECDEDESLCSVCEEGYLPDENGGCTYASNCEVSSEGICIKCKTDYILIGKNTTNNIYDNLKICKFNKSEEFKNCEAIDYEKGHCQYCKQDYFLTGKDKKCVKIQYCALAKFGVCKECNPGYYLDKSQDKCLQQKEQFLHCKVTLDGEKCDTCLDDFNFDENDECIRNKFCLNEKDYKCEKCIEGYYLTGNYDCVNDKNCKVGKKDLGVCTLCKDYYYLDYKDGKCKSNLENEDFRYCKEADKDLCIKCADRYYLSKDGKCTDTQFCSEVENGTCTYCDENYYLGLDKICNNVKGCIYSKNGECSECEGDYYFDTNNRTCKVAENEFSNCKSGIESLNCGACKNGFYLNQTDYLCYPNSEKNQFYKCAYTDYSAETCLVCEDGYYLGITDNLCSTVEGCEISENGNRCLKCDSDFYCLNKKTGNCEINYEIEKEEQKIYFRCNETNDEGTKCKKCVDEDKYVINEDGICIDDKHCEEKEDGVCIKCSNELFDSYCLNSDFGCMYSIYQNCLECNDSFNLYKCTKCHDGYELNKYNICIKKGN